MTDWRHSGYLTVDEALGRTAEAPAADVVDARWAKLLTVMTRAVRRQCPTWLVDLAPDIAQAALMKVMKAEQRLAAERPLSSFYLFRVAHSALVDEIRRRRRLREIALEVVTETGEDYRPAEPIAGDDPERDASFRELGAAVRGCLLTMNRERRLAVALHLQSHTVPEAARILGWKVKRTENLVYRGLANLRECLRRKGHTP